MNSVKEPTTAAGDEVGTITRDRTTADIYRAPDHKIQAKTYLELVNEVDSFPYPDQGAEYEVYVSRLYRFCLLESWNAHCSTTVKVGLILPSVAHTMPWTSMFRVDHEERTVSIPFPRSEKATAPSSSESDAASASNSAPADNNNTSGAPTSKTATDTHDTTSTPSSSYESDAIAEQLARARSLDTFSILRGWRDEVYPIFGVSRDIRMERSASALFGILTVGVHLNGYVRSPLDGSLSLWIPRRAATKSTYPSMLDNTVAGGIPAGEDVFEALVREAGEEASLPVKLVKEKTVATGTISYFHVRDAKAGGETGLLQPETQYIYDLELEEGVIPKQRDGEVMEFYLWGVERVERALRAGEFKPNCALCLIDFLIRHGRITQGDERDYRELVARLHRRLRF